MPHIADQVKLFYDQLWNQENFSIAGQILAEGVTFRGSLGPEMVGREKVCDYVRSVTSSLSQYSCELLDLVTEGERAAAKVLFKGIHAGIFMGSEPTGNEIEWLGTAFFRSSGGLLTEIWVLGDIDGLRKKLESNIRRI